MTDVYGLHGPAYRNGKSVELTEELEDGLIAIAEKHGNLSPARAQRACRKLLRGGPAVPTIAASEVIRTMARNDGRRFR